MAIVTTLIDSAYTILQLATFAAVVLALSTPAVLAAAVALWTYTVLLTTLPVGTDMWTGLSRLA